VKHSSFNKKKDTRLEKIKLIITQLKTELIQLSQAKVKSQNPPVNSGKDGTKDPQIIKIAADLKKNIAQYNYLRRIESKKKLKNTVDDRTQFLADFYKWFEKTFLPEFRSGIYKDQNMTLQERLFLFLAKALTAQIRDGRGNTALDSDIRYYATISPTISRYLNAFESFDNAQLLSPRYPSRKVRLNFQLIKAEKLKYKLSMLETTSSPFGNQPIDAIGLDLNRMKCFRTLTYCSVDAKGEVISMFDKDLDESEKDNIVAFYQAVLPCPKVAAENFYTKMVKIFQGEKLKKIQNKIEYPLWTKPSDAPVPPPSSQSNNATPAPHDFTAVSIKKMQWLDVFNAPIFYWAEKNAHLQRHISELSNIIRGTKNIKPEYLRRIKRELYHLGVAQTNCRNAQVRYMQRLHTYILQKTQAKKVYHEKLHFKQEGGRGTLAAIVQGMVKNYEGLQLKRKELIKAMYLSSLKEETPVNAPFTSAYYYHSMRHRLEEKKQILDRTASADWGVLYADQEDHTKQKIMIIDAHFHAAKNMVQSEYGNPANGPPSPPPP
jgi:hypothetical protein